MNVSGTRIQRLAVAALAVAFVTQTSTAEELAPIAKDSGFAWIDGDDTIPHVVKRERVKKGVRRPGHPRDIIAPIYESKFYASIAEAEKDLGLGAGDRVLGLVIGGEARAYPTRILDQHEVANDTIGERPLAVIW